MSFRARMPFLPLAGSSTLLVTKSIFDMTFIQGTSRLTIADIAESTPLHNKQHVRVTLIEKHWRNRPEELVLIFHKLRLD